MISNQLSSNVGLIHRIRVLGTLEAMANRQNDDENQSDDDAKDYELYLHVFKPQLSFHLCSLCSKILCLLTHSEKKKSMLPLDKSVMLSICSV